MIILLRGEMSSGLISSPAPPAAAIGPSQLSAIMKEHRVLHHFLTRFLKRVRKPLGLSLKSRAGLQKFVE